MIELLISHIRNGRTTFDFGDHHNKLENPSESARLVQDIRNNAKNSIVFGHFSHIDCMVKPKSKFESFIQQLVLIL